MRTSSTFFNVSTLRPNCQLPIQGAPSAIGNDLVRGVIVQFGGQTPLNLAQGLKDAGVPILGTQPEMIHLAEDREQSQKVLRELSLLQPPSGVARSRGDARAAVSAIRALSRSEDGQEPTPLTVKPLQSYFAGQET